MNTCVRIAPKLCDLDCVQLPSIPSSATQLNLTTAPRQEVAKMEQGWGSRARQGRDSLVHVVHTKAMSLSGNVNAEAMKTTKTMSIELQHVASSVSGNDRLKRSPIGMLVELSTRWGLSHDGFEA